MTSDEKYGVQYLEASSPAVLAVDIDTFFQQFPRISIRTVDYFNVMEANQLQPNMPRVVFSAIIIYKIIPDFE